MPKVESYIVCWAPLWLGTACCLDRIPHVPQVERGIVWGWNASRVVAVVAPVKWCWFPAAVPLKSVRTNGNKQSVVLVYGVVPVASIFYRPFWVAHTGAIETTAVPLLLWHRLLR